ncbi:MAG: 23S rRNA (guanosine(2251)-2'-O)-methyltransferase RlmB [Candidatus Dormibacteraceae bacterium]
MKGRRSRPGSDPADDLINGRNAVLEAARAGRLRRLYLAAGLHRDPRLEELRRLLPAAQVEEVPAARLDVLCPGVHQGVVGRLKPRAYLDLRRLLASRPTLLVALDGVLDPHNLGAILRSAEAAGADAALLPERRSAPLSAAAVKASSGATELLPICRVAGLASTLPELGRHGIWTVALDPRGDRAPWAFDLSQPVCIVVGGEDQGVHRLVRERCDARLRLPMAGRVGSLNASVSAGIVLFEAVRQRAVPAGASSALP